jgi:hypothetical protein
VITKCRACGQSLARTRQWPNLAYCQECRAKPSIAAVYRFVCPDGRSYVGAQNDCRKRPYDGIQRTNSRMSVAFKQYPPDTWTYEVLEVVPRGGALRKAEQRHINRLRSWDPKFGFNIFPAIWKGNGPSQRNGRQYLAELARSSMARWLAGKEAA